MTARMEQQSSATTFQVKLRDRDRLIGLWCSLCSGIALDVITDSGFDWLLIDTEHSPNELPDVLHHLQIAARSPAGVVVRPAWNDPILIKRLLDIGAENLLIPFIETADAAKAAVAATRYPPHGERGVTGSGRASRYGRDMRYLKDANNRIGVLLQIETRAGLHNLGEIASIPGVDGIFIGPSDLAASLGHIGNPQHSDVQAALKRAAERLHAMGKAAGILTGKPEEARRYLDWGYTFVAVGTDVGLLAKAADRLCADFQTTTPIGNPN